MSRRGGIAHVAALDGLRGVAVAGVLAFHGGHLTGGYLGVDLFFVLSGFLITSLLLVESHESDTIALSEFWARRARRLLPALAGMLGGVALYCVFFAKPAELAQIRGDAFATVAYVANWRAVFAHHDYWSLFQAPSPLQHTWSLAIEEQFYLLWPLIVVGLLATARRRTPAAVLAVAATGAVASSALMAWAYDPANVSRVYYGTDTRAASILVGAALAAGLAIWGPVRGRSARIGIELAGLGAIAFLTWAWASVPGQSSFLYHGGFLLCGVAAATVIAAASHPRRALIAHALGVRPLCALGVVSYGVYLWHWPVYVVLDESRSGLDGYALLAVRAAVTLGIAVVSYFVLELPIRRGALSIRQSRWAIPAVASILLVAIAASTAGAKARITVADARPESVHTAVRRAAAAPVSVRRVMVVGNSVGWFLGRALEQSGATPPVVAFNAAHPACVFPSGITSYHLTGPGGSVDEPTTPCDQHWSAELALFRPSVVLWVVSPGTDEALYDGTWTRLCDPAYDTSYRRDLGHAVEELRTTGAQVVLTTAAYIRFGSADSQKDRRFDCDNAIRRGVARATGAQLVDLFSFTCPDGICRKKIGDVVLRPDGLHYEGASARIVAQWILQRTTSVRLARSRAH